MKSFSPLKQNIRVRPLIKSSSKEKDSSKTKIQPQRLNQQFQSQSQEKKFYSSTIELIIQTQNVQTQQKKRNSPAHAELSRKKGKALTLGKENFQKYSNNFKAEKTLLENFPESIQNQNQLPSIFSNKTRNQLGPLWNEKPDSEKNFLSTQIFDDSLYQQIQKQKFNSKQIPSHNNTVFTQNHNMTFSRSCWFTIQNVLDVCLKPELPKTSVEVQTLDMTNDDKYYLSYMKQRILKQRAYEDMLFKESRLEALLQETEDFSRNYKNLIEYVNQGPTNDREERVFALAVDLEKQQKIIKEVFDKIISDSSSLESQIFTKISSLQSKSQILASSIKNLTDACILELLKKLQISQIFENENAQNKKVVNNAMKESVKKVMRILTRVSRQIMNLEKSISYSNRFGETITERFKEKVKLLKRQHEKWKNLQYENRVLLYNFMNRVKEFPAVALSLFGEKENLRPLQCTQEKKVKTSDEDRFDAYMKVKCECCFEMKNRIQLLKENNQKIKPMFKVIEWLIRDGSKPKKSLQLI